MPTLMLRGLSSDLVCRIKSYASTKALPPRDAAAQLLTIALDHLEARAAGGRARQQIGTPAERSQRAREAVEQRWAKSRP